MLENIFKRCADCGGLNLKNSSCGTLMTELYNVQMDE